MTTDQTPTDPRNGATILSEAQCWERLKGTSLGRIAVAVANRPDIFPINYGVLDETIVLRTTEGSKLASVAINDAIAFEIDGRDEDTNLAWSVVLHGSAEIVEHDETIDRIEAMAWFPWNEAPKNRFIQITATSLSGRAFVATGRKG